MIRFRAQCQRGLLSVAAVPLLVLIACGSGPASSGNTSTSTSSSSSTSTSSSTASAGPVLQTVKVSETEFKLDPATVNLSQAGTYVFHAVNAGTVGHALEIQGNGLDFMTNTFQAGQSADLKVTLKAGTYQMFCPVDGHKGLGMLSQVIVAG